MIDIEIGLLMTTPPPSSFLNNKTSEASPNLGLGGSGGSTRYIHYIPSKPILSTCLQSPIQKGE